MHKPATDSATDRAPDDIAVRLRRLRKVYRLYRKPSYRVRDILGLLPADPRYYDEHVALHDLTLDIRRGEKVAIIGRNGAGKSTLLKLITRVIPPTAGTVETFGETQALLSIGTGFHPELTGRENVIAYLGHFGVTGRRARDMLADIIGFAEVEEYIDQPIKTYSTGMGMRLMFAASTMFVPNLLVIDEVLGVGDAYFQAKSFERIREICGAQGATLLLVTHDIFAASTLCERMIWIDQGAVLLDADSPSVLKAYDTSIRQQEEARLRKKALMQAQRMVRSTRGDAVTLLIELRSAMNVPAPTPIVVARIALMDGEQEIAAASLTSDAPETEHAGALITDSGAWGATTTWKGRPGREIRNFGSSLHKVGVSFLIPRALVARLDDLTLDVEVGADRTYGLEAWRIDADLRSRSLGPLPSVPGEWATFRAKLAGTGGAGPAQAAQSVRENEQNGSGRIVITGVQLLDGSGLAVHQIEHGAPARLLLDYEIRDPSLHERCQVILVFMRNGIEDICRLFETGLLFDAATQPKGQLMIRWAAMPLGAAEYAITGLVAAENYYDERPTQFYSINPKVYWARRGFFEFKVISEHPVATGTGVVGDATWSLVQGGD
jgi:ABC-type polysaccharide/polyol phosphate transport system ATPase subunit